jgi:type II secretory pathway component PulF
VRAARSDLRAQGLVPVLVEAINNNADGARQRLFFSERFIQRGAGFLPSAAGLLEAGLPLEQSLTALLEQSERTFIRDIIASVRSEVMAGAAYLMRRNSIRMILPTSIALWWRQANKLVIWRVFIASGRLHRAS